MAVARMSRAERQAHTRRALLEAGREVFVRDGFHRATLDRVAAEAGFTKGAVYANFPTKADLFLAVFEQRVETRRTRIRAVAERAASAHEAQVAFTDEWQRVLRDERAWSLLLIEFWVHAARDDELRARLRELHLRIREAIVEVLRERVGELPGELDAEAFVTAQMALGNGLNLEAFLDVDGVADTMDRASEALYKGAFA
jgi:AcrR family transcriptional regulator